MSADCAFCGLTCNTRTEYEEHGKVCSLNPANVAARELGERLEAAWTRLHAAAAEVTELTLRRLARTVRELVPEAATLHLVIRYPDDAGGEDRWMLSHLRDADSKRIELDREVEDELGDSLNDALADLAFLSDVQEFGVVDLHADPPSFIRFDSQEPMFAYP